MNPTPTAPVQTVVGSAQFAIGALLLLLGWITVARLLALVAKRVGAVADIERAQAGRALLGTGALAAGLLLIGSLLVRYSGPGGPSAEPNILLQVPIVWFVMPWTAWLAAVSLVMMGLRGFQSLGSVTSQERRSRLLVALAWLGSAVFFLFLFRTDLSSTFDAVRGAIPRTAANFFAPDLTSKIEILRGGIPLTAANVVSLLLFAVIAVAAMTISSRSLSARGFAKGLATQAALLVGTFVFGLPFAFLLVTSFKEDKDMASPNGIVWVPKVTREVMYVDPLNTVFEAKMPDDEGGLREVEATKLKELPNGRVQMEVFKPLAIRGTTFETDGRGLVKKAQPAKIVDVKWDGKPARGFIASNLPTGDVRVRIMEPAALKDQERDFRLDQTTDVRDVGLRTQNYSDALQYLPPETNYGLVYLKNTLILVVAGVVGTIASSSIVAYAFSRMRFPGKKSLFNILLATMMLPGAVTLLPQFLIFKSFGWIDTLYPLTVPAFFGSAFNIFLLRQFFMQIPMELEDAAKIDGCGYLKTFWSIMIPQIKPALTVIAIWTFMGAWNNFMGPLIYINSPEIMPLSYALQLFQGDRGGEPGLLMAFSTMTLAPVLALFFFTQRYFIEGVTLSGLGGR